MKIIDFLARSIVLLDKGQTLLIKIKALTVLAVSLSPLAMIAEAFRNWVHVNIVFIYFVFGAIIIDHLFGTYVHAMIKRDFSLKKNITGFFTKTGLSIAVYFIGQGIVHILGGSNPIAVYFNVVLSLMVFLYPAGSALISCSIMTGGTFPPFGLMQKIKKFNENLDLSQFKNKEEENKNNPL